ncbi:UvrD-helicase domain-containing protein [Klebsiella aerogenes]|uniref:AAA family ATPase n=1 Tax=Klebsiella aerogenes TaxID=548 RepID=A0AAP9R329_KLEAE|nr:UvrD-helicase domain-containing protein [Klebsiella aerogenes]QMR42939.1 AAA family ATPase [Klebsiella aerogenes]
MSYTRTPEQDAVIRLQGQLLVVGEFACTGKTTTLMRYAQANPQRRMLCLAYNRAIRDEAERKFPFNVECKTSHQLAWANFGRHYQKRLRGNLRITDVARLRNSRFWPLAKTAQTTLTNFLCSAEPKPRLIHLPPEEDRAGIDPGQMLGAAQILWQKMQCTDGVFPVTHDTYLKLFQLSIPDMATRRDTILFDETQDANPVTPAIVLNQPCRVILVGDRHEQIYRFRGADSALDVPVLAGADRLWLTQSFRCGLAVARQANVLLREAGEPRAVTGSETDDEVLARLPAEYADNHYTVLSRIVTCVIGAALTASLEEKHVYWVGGIEGYRTEEQEDLFWFSADMPERMKTTALLREYRDYDEYCRVAKATSDAEMGQSVRLLEMYFPLPQKLAIMRRQAVTREKDANVTVCTAHRSKGLEWPVVVLGDDFADIPDPLLSTDERTDEINLLYVSTIRAMKMRVINEVMEVLNGQDNVHIVTKAIKTGPVLNVATDDSREAEEDEGRSSNGDDAVEALC